MSKRPYVIVSCAQSLDGRIDDASDTRLLLSNEEDFDRVDALRATVDAILVGAGALKIDNPRLLVRSAGRQAARQQRGLSPNPIKVTLTDKGDLDPTAKFFTTGPAKRLVYCPSSIAKTLQKRLGDSAEVVGLGAAVTIPKLLADLYKHGVGKLMVEGGSHILTQFFTAGLVDELQLVTAGFFVGDAAAPRFVGDGSFPWDQHTRMRITDARILGDDVMCVRYVAPHIVKADEHWMRIAMDESRKCPSSATAFSVGAVIVGADGKELSRGYSRELDPVEHAEEAALRKLPAAADLRGATVYSTLEPCSARASRPKACTYLLMEHPIARVVYALAEPPIFVDCDGTEQLRAAGITVDVLPTFADEFRSINAHLYKNKE